MTTLALFQFLPVFWEWGWAAVLGAGLAGFALDWVLGRGLGKCPVKNLYVRVFCCSVSLENPDSHTPLGISPAGRAPKLVQWFLALYHFPEPAFEVKCRISPANLPACHTSHVRSIAHHSPLPHTFWHCLWHLQGRLRGRATCAVPGPWLESSSQWWEALPLLPRNEGL